MRETIRKALAIEHTTLLRRRAELKETMQELNIVVPRASRGVAEVEKSMEDAAQEKETEERWNQV